MIQVQLFKRSHKRVDGLVVQVFKMAILGKFPYLAILRARLTVLIVTVVVNRI